MAPDLNPLAASDALLAPLIRMTGSSPCWRSFACNCKPSISGILTSHSRHTGCAGCEPPQPVASR